MAATISQATTATRLVSRVVCPHCWHNFPPEDVLWTSEHIDLLGDTLLGRDQQQRFLPSRFTPQGDALDARGVVCHRLSCPHCHLAVPRGMLESEPLFLSVLGAPLSGKSYFLAAAMWKLREVMTTTFGVSFQDADPAANIPLNEAEKQLFLNSTPDDVFIPSDLIDKTKAQGVGVLADDISYGQHTITYPRPYLFSLQLNDRHPNAAKGGWDHTLCLYDNAGEHWMPGADTPTSHVTRHLAHSRVILYLFDPMQDRRFRDAARRGGDSVQVGVDSLNRQETILNEAAARIRRYCGLAQKAKIDRPLIVVLPKFDAWSHLLDHKLYEQPWGTSPKHPVALLHTEHVDQVSASVRRLLEGLCPEVVNSADALAGKVTYIPISVLNGGITRDPTTGKTGVRPGEIRPFWVTVPFLYAFQMAVPSLIARPIRKTS